MRLLKSTLTAVLCITASAAMALNPLPKDPDVRTGTLPNGLTYYLRHNNVPAAQADFYLAQRVGSVNETESQRGLAHFLEHMCFNGTRHFPGNSLITYLESLGVKFGANLNAYTSTDETVYNICKVPATRQTALDSCLLILRDWSHDLTLDGKDIDEERGVIEGEWRQRQGSANLRMLEKAAPEVYGDNIYGHRMPIGLMSVVRNFSHDTLRDYYNKWYHPCNQAVVVVGDIDVDVMENRIKDLWKDIPAAPASALAPTVEVADNRDIIVSVQSDPEQTSSNVILYLKHDDLDPAYTNTIEELRRDLAADLVSAMLAERFDALEEKPEAAFTNLGVGDMKFLLSRTRHALMVRAGVKAGREQQAVGQFADILKQAATHGFTETELKRAVIDARAKLDNAFASRNSVTNTEYARRYVRNYLDGGAMPSAEQNYKMMKGVIGTMDTTRVNNYIRDIVKDDAGHNTVIIAYLPSGTAVTPDALASAWSSVHSADLAPYVDSAVEGCLLAEEPMPGKITAEQKLDAFGSKIWTLSNGVRVHLRHNDAKADQVLIQGYGEGGLSQGYDASLAPEYRLVNDVLAVSAAGAYTTSQMRKLLAGKSIRSDIKIDNMRESMGVATTPGDMEDAFRLIYLKATDLRPDTAAFRSLVENRRLKLSSTQSNPTFIMGDSIHANVYGHHPLGEKVSLADLDAVSYDRIMDLYHKRFSDMGNFTFYIAGNFNEDSLRGYVERYLAALPTSGQYKGERADIGYRYASGRGRRTFHCPMEVPQSICYTFYNTTCPYNLENVVKGHMLGTLIADSLRQDIREKRGWTYGVKGHAGISAGMNGNDPASLIMPVYIRVAPENADSTFLTVAQTVDAFADKRNISVAQVDKVRRNMLRDYADNADDNVYWITVMNAYDRFGQDMHNGYEKIANAITPQTLADFARRYMLNANRLQLEMAPN